jgi:uncharacterized membrane protein (UPF0127 family)
MRSQVVRRPRWVPIIAGLAAGVVALLLVGGGFLGTRTFLRAEREQASGAPAGTANGKTTVAYELRDEGGAPVTVQLEVAAAPEQRQIGLSKRESLAQGTGMVFLFPYKTDGRFWMKDTLVPLSIAFLDTDGTVIEVMDMQPCRADPCPEYGPSKPYVAAVELNLGAFAAAGIEPGDKVVPVDPSLLPSPI